MRAAQSARACPYSHRHSRHCARSSAASTGMLPDALRRAPLLVGRTLALRARASARQTHSPGGTRSAPRGYHGSTPTPAPRASVTDGSSTSSPPPARPALVGGRAREAHDDCLEARGHGPARGAIEAELGGRTPPAAGVGGAVAHRYGLRPVHAPAAGRALVGPRGPGHQDTLGVAPVGEAHRTPGLLDAPGAVGVKSSLHAQSPQRSSLGVRLSK